MHAMAIPIDSLVSPAYVSLSELPPRAVALVRAVGNRASTATALERRLIELGFVGGERVEVLTQAAPGGDPFVIRVGDTSFALRRHEVATVWVEIVSSPGKS